MEDPTPLIWPQSNASVPRLRRSPPSPLLSPPVLIILLPVVVLLIAIFAIPSFLSITSQILRPNYVRNSWDSLNVFLVLFAILCGVLAGRNNDVSSQPPSSYGEDCNSTVTNVADDAGDQSKPLSVSQSQQWFSDLYEVDRLKINESVRGGTASVGLPATGHRRLRRSSSSYPDLRRCASQETGNHRFRSFDDFEIRSYQPAAVSYDDYNRFRNQRKVQIEESEAKKIPLDAIELRSSSTRRQPPPPPTEMATFKQKPKRAYQSDRHREKREKTRFSSEAETSKIKQKPPPEAPPPPPPPPPRPPVSSRVLYESDTKLGRSERRKSNATKENKMVFPSLHNQRKRKRNLQKEKKSHSSSHEDHQHNDSPVMQPPSEYHSTIPPPSPAPPPPPPQNVFYGLFKKRSKSKKIHSVPVPPPPTPPTSPPSFTQSWRGKIQAGAAAVQSAAPPPPRPPPPPSLKQTWKRKIQAAAAAAVQSAAKPTPSPPTPALSTHLRRRPGRPPLPTRQTVFLEENLNSGGQATLIPIQPPPLPPPPFKLPEMKFVFRGDFAKRRSNQSSRCGSPEREEINLGLETVEAEKLSRWDGGSGSAFCPSPDVNIKADSFIAWLRENQFHEIEAENGCRLRPNWIHNTRPSWLMCQN